MDSMLPPPRIEQRSRSMCLAPGWSRTVFFGWTGMIAALACIGVSSHIIGRPVFWLDDQRWSPVVLVLLALAVVVPLFSAALWAYTNRSWIPVVSGCAAVVLCAIAFVDRHSSPGAAVVEGALAVAAILLTGASFLGRYRSVPQ